MGSEFDWQGSNQPKLHILASGSDRIRRIEIVRNNNDVHVIHSDEFNLDLEWSDPTDLSNVSITDPWGSHIIFYYVRIIQVDGEMAWSSPVWLRTRP